MASFDSNTWYQIEFSQADSAGDQYLGSGGLGAAAVHLKTDNQSSPNQQWQMLPSVDDTWVLRTNAMGSLAYMCAFDGLTSGTLKTNSTQVAMCPEGAPSDVDSAEQWTILPVTGTEVYSFSNLANGSTYVLYADSSNVVQMATDVEVAWSFTSISAINNALFSVGATSTSSRTSSVSATSTIASSGAIGSSSPFLSPAISASAPTSSTTSSSKPSAHSGLSSGAAAAIGAVLGIAFIAFLVAMFYFFRRKRGRREIPVRDEWDKAEMPAASPSTMVYAPPAELYANNAVEMQDSTETRKSNQKSYPQTYHEMDGDPIRKEKHRGLT